MGLIGLNALPAIAEPHCMQEFRTHRYLMQDWKNVAAADADTGTPLMLMIAKTATVHREYSLSRLKHAGTGKHACHQILQTSSVPTHDINDARQQAGVAAGKVGALEHA